MIRRRIISALVALTLFGSAAGCQSAAPQAAATAAPAAKAAAPAASGEIPTFIVANYGASTVPYVVLEAQYVEKLKERTKGKLNVQFFPEGTVYQDKDMPDVVPAGKVDHAMATLGQFTGMVPAAALFGYPLFDDWDHVERATAGGLSDLLNAEFAKYKIKVLGWVNLGPPLVTNSKQPLKTPADFKGLTFRAYSEESAAWIQAVGGAPTFIPYAEQYLALQRGTVQGATGGLTGMAGQKLWEVQKHLLYPEGLFGVINMAFMTNTERLAKLPPDLQKIVVDWSNEFTAAANNIQRDEYWGEGDFKGKGIGLMTSSGMTMTRPEQVDEKWWPALAPMRDKFIDKLGPVGKQIIDVVQKTKKK